MTKLKDDKTCWCPFNISRGKLYESYCRFGCCILMRCPWCKMVAMEWGPVFCKHKNQWYRKLIYPDMDTKTPTPVKKNSLRHRSRPRKKKGTG